MERSRAEQELQGMLSGFPDEALLRRQERVQGDLRQASIELHELGQRFEDLKVERFAVESELGNRGLLISDEYPSE